jgi:hypothetical protein
MDGCTVVEDWDDEDGDDGYGTEGSMLRASGHAEGGGVMIDDCEEWPRGVDVDGVKVAESGEDAAEAVACRSRSEE